MHALILGCGGGIPDGPLGLLVLLALVLTSWPYNLVMFIPMGLGGFFTLKTVSELVRDAKARRQQQPSRAEAR